MMHDELSPRKCGICQRIPLAMHKFCYQCFERLEKIAQQDQRDALTDPNPYEYSELYGDCH